jgi:hypothetical protein
VQTITTELVKGRDPLVPFAVSYGLGVDSTAMLVELVRRGIRPDLILFADTGAELPETYAYLPVMDEYLRAHGFPEVVVVRKRSKHRSLYDNCLSNETLPSLAFGMKSCSLKWKVDPMNAYCNRWAPARACWKAGEKVIKAIGYDAGGRDVERFCHSQENERKRPDRKYAYWHPLIAWGIDRPGCAAAIRGAGLPVPPKSACYFCPARKDHEVVELKANHPALFQAAVRLETTARDGKHGLRTTKGLGRTWAWGERHGDTAAAAVRR